MGIEIEKKYRLTPEQASLVRKRLLAVGATPCGEDFEENTLYAGHDLDPRSRILRLRRAGDTCTLTYKERF